MKSRKNNADTSERASTTAYPSLSTPGADFGAITRYPAVPSIFGASGEEPDIEEDDSDSEDASDDVIYGSDRPCNLRNVGRVQYSNVTITDIVDEPDTMKLSKALKSAQCDQWIAVVNNELDVTMTNGTWKKMRRTGLSYDETILPP